ncbi:MAG: CHAT domain-containing protein [Anaerolineae bacterium]|nr:CHAT domain-containing protein [Anaerolineae bacterium]
MTTSHTFANLEIRIQEHQEQGYKVDFTLNHEQEFGPGRLDPSAQPDLTGVPADDGQALLTWLLADTTLQKAWERIRGQYPRRRLRLRIDADAPELHALPWELLREATDGTPALDLAAAESTPFSRYLAGAWQPGSPILQRPIKILVAIANPTNLQERYKLAPLDVDKEWADLQQVTEGVNVKLTLLPQPCTLAALQAELKKGYHILHYIGHGAFSEQQEKAVLFMADEDNQVALVSDSELSEVLATQLSGSDTQREDTLRLVFLASCQTATRSPADAFRGLAPGLVAAGVPAVLAMQDLVPVDTARAFSRVFYQQLLSHGLVDLASNEARAALLAAKKPGAAIPVLFMRLREGVLLAQEGRITSSRSAAAFWPFLLDKIYDSKCTPFLGPGVTKGLLPQPETLAEQLATQYEYPLPDRRNLARVAQYMVINAGHESLRQTYLEQLQKGLYTALGESPPQAARGGRRRGSSDTLTLTQTIDQSGWVERILKLQENEIHHRLADIEFPLYITTNVDNFMLEAIKHKQRQQIEAGERKNAVDVRREGPRWQPEAGRPKYTLDPDPDLDHPVVFHLNGYDDGGLQEENLVLSEDDYLAHFARISHDQETILPTNLLGMLSEHTFLFLGYKLEDWQFRVVLQGLLDRIAQAGSDTKLHVGVQLAIEDAPDIEKAQAYLEDYLKRFNISIYWGTTQQFVTELHTRWLTYLAKKEAAG